MKRKSRIIILFALALLLLIPSIVAEAKAEPKLAAKKSRSMRNSKRNCHTGGRA